MIKRLFFLFIISSLSISFAYSAEVNIYTYRQAHLIKPLLDTWSAQSGIKTNILYLKDGIAEKMQFEGEKSPADVILTADIYRLRELQEKGLTQAVVSAPINKAIPTQLRDLEGHWSALTIRARVIYTSAERTEIGEVQSYNDLAHPGLGKRICTRPLSHIYNLGLVSSLIAQQGQEAAKQWLLNLKDNLARRPQGNDRAQIKAINQDICDYAIGNSYYFGLLAHDEPEWTQNIRIIMPQANKGGTHINISGMALARYAPNPEAAKQLMEFLVSREAQEYYASTNHEFPARVDVPPSAFLKDTFGEFDTQQLAMATIAQFAPQAQSLIEQVGIDN